MYFRKMFVSFFVLFSVLLITSYSDAETVTGSASFDAWSGFWWPKNQGALANGYGYRGNPSPLQKYDLYVNGNQENGPAVSEFYSKLYDQNAEYWHGLCHAFAAAAVTENISFKPSVIDNILFRIGDKKGLVTLCHDLDWMNAVVKGANPVNLHYFLLKYIKEEKRGFYADFDPTIEYWSYPVYKFTMDITETGNQKDVKVSLLTADDFVSPDYDGTKQVTRNYEYRLYTQNGEIVSGEWLGDSVTNHPDTLIMPGARAKTLDSVDYDTVKKIASTVDDELENGSAPVPIAPGSYNLLLLDPDEYVINAAPSDIVRFEISKLEGSETTNFEITDSANQVLYSGSLGIQKKEIAINGGIPPYRLRLSQMYYPADAANYYNLKLDIRSDIRSGHFSEVLKIQKGSLWNGMAVVNPTGKNVNNIYVTGYSKSGSPVQTYLGPFSLSPGEKKTFTFDSFHIRNIDKSDLSSIRIIAPDDLKSIYLAGLMKKYMIGNSYSRPSRHMVMPDAAGRADTDKTMAWGFSNSSLLSSMESELKLFSKSGSEIDNVFVSTPPGGTNHYYEGYTSPFVNTSYDGWIDISSSQDFSGYSEWTRAFATRSDNLPLAYVSKSFCVPHLEIRSIWSTRLVLINVSGGTNAVNVKLCPKNGNISEATVYLSRYEKKNLEIGEIFPQLDRETISSSGLILTSTEDMSGYCSYENQYDDLYCPFMDSKYLSASFTLPHTVSDSFWWTAFIVFNPNETPVNLQIVPYDESGVELSGLIKYVTIAQLSKHVSTVAEMFGPASGRISFIKINNPSGSGLYGIYAYGSHDGEMIAGGVLE